MEPTTSNNGIKAIKEVRQLFNDLKSRKELYKKETVYNFLKGKDSVTNKQKIVLKNINIILRN